MTHSVVTGGAGFIGSHLCEALLSQGHRVTCVDNVTTGSRAAMASRTAMARDSRMRLGRQNTVHRAKNPGFSVGASSPRYSKFESKTVFFIRCNIAFQYRESVIFPPIKSLIGQFRSAGGKLAASTRISNPFSGAIRER